MAKKSKRQKKVTVDDGIDALKKALDEAAPRPPVTSHPSVKTAYATRFAESIAKSFAEGLSNYFDHVEASSQRRAGSVRGNKQLDIHVSTPQLGLVLGVSLKSVHLRDQKSGRYTHNTKRNEEELRIEASGYHERQPFAVMIAVLFLPLDSVSDGKRDNPSSFGSFVRKLRPYTGRASPRDEPDRFEQIFIALYDPNGTELRFFDVAKAPPKNGLPAQTLSYPAFLDAAYDAFLARNNAKFEWAGGEAAPLSIDEEAVEDEEAADDGNE